VRVGSELLVERHYRHHADGQVEGAVAADIETGGQGRILIEPVGRGGGTELLLGEERDVAELPGITHDHRSPRSQERRADRCSAEGDRSARA
jgi:hypothetical protein